MNAGATVIGTCGERNFDYLRQIGVKPVVYGDGLADALRAATLPAGDLHAWIGCESAAAKALRAHLVGERGLNPKWVRASGYWRRGSAATHDTHDE